jgi:hypothetical protein
MKLRTHCSYAGHRGAGGHVTRVSCTPSPRSARTTLQTQFEGLRPGHRPLASGEPAPVYHLLRVGRSDDCVGG